MSTISTFGAFTTARLGMTAETFQHRRAIGQRFVY